MKMKRYLILLGLVLLGIVGCSEKPQPQSDLETISVPVEGLVRSGKSTRYFVPPPEIPEQPQGVDNVPFNITFNPASSCGSGLSTWPAEAVTAVTYAANIWGALLSARVSIRVDACWLTTLPSDNLANAQPITYRRNFANAPQQNTWYPIALANDFAVSDLDPSNPDIIINFNANQTWYFGTNGATPTNRVDLVTVALHEFGHGLGFLGSMNYNCNGTNQVGCWGLAAADGTLYPVTYDRFAQNGSGQNLVTGFTNNSVSLGNQLVGQNLFFNGTNANGANGNAPPRLYAPAVWDGGSSFSHLDTGSYQNTINGLMVHALDDGVAIHNPGPIVLGAMRDIGWFIRNYNETFVRSSNNGYEDGSAYNPFNTVTEGANTVAANGTLWIWAGGYSEAVTFLRPMIIDKWNIDGAVVIGASQ